MSDSLFLGAGRAHSVSGLSKSNMPSHHFTHTLRDRQGCVHFAKRGPLPCLYTHVSSHTHTVPAPRLVLATTAVSQQGNVAVAAAAAAADAGHFAPSITCCRYPSVLNDSISASRWPLKAPTVPTSTMWFQQSNPCVDNLP